jgi:hypothetical protein
VGPALDRPRDLLRRGIREEDWYELVADGAGVVEELADDPRLPDDAQALALPLVPLDPAVISLRADHQHHVGSIDLPLAPERPALGRRGVVLIDLGVDAVCSEPIGKA